MLGELRQEILGDHLPGLEHLAEFGRAHTHRAGGDLEGARQTLAQLAAQFLSLDRALAHHLRDGQQRAVGLG